MGFYDAIVVGARCAGAPTAMLLARRGHTVLLVDRATFPSDTMSTHFLHPRGLQCLERWGLGEALRQTGCPPIGSWHVDFEGLAVDGLPVAPDGAPPEAMAPRRVVLDELLVKAAAEAAAEVREDFTVEELVREGDAVAGIRGRAGGGGAIEERARIVIGADGVRSLVARQVQARMTLEKPMLTCGYYGLFSGTGVEILESYAWHKRWAVAFPTHGGLTMAYVAWPVAEFDAFRADIAAGFWSTFDRAPGLGERMRAGKQEQRFVGTGTLPNFFRRSYGPGWALAGDAGYHKDPITAHGISDAFASANLLAAAVADGLSGRRPMLEALAAYERRRDEEARALFEWNYQVAALSPLSPRIAALLRALAGNAADTARYLGLYAGTVTPAEFFHPDNIARIIAAAR